MTAGTLHSAESTLERMAYRDNLCASADANLEPAQVIALHGLYRTQLHDEAAMHLPELIGIYALQNLAQGHAEYGLFVGCHRTRAAIAGPEEEHILDRDELDAIAT